MAIIYVLMCFFFLFTGLFIGLDLIESLILSDEHRLIRFIVWPLWAIGFITTVLFVLDKIGANR